MFVGRQKRWEFHDRDYITDNVSLGQNWQVKMLNYTQNSSRFKDGSNSMISVVYHLPQIPGNSGWDVNDKRFFGSSHWKIPGTGGNSEKVVQGCLPFDRKSRLGCRKHSGKRFASLPQKCHIRYGLNPNKGRICVAWVWNREGTAKTSVSPRSSPLGTFRAEERLRPRDRNSILMMQINVYIINPSSGVRQTQAADLQTGR